MSTSGTTITLHVNDGTLFATPNSGHARARGASTVRWVASFPFDIEFAVLTGGAAPADGSAGACDPAGFAFQLTLPDENSSYKYTIKGGAGGEAAGLVLDPIIIIDKR
ncbi:MAG: hypothetical protein JSR36_03940 [Proteobacteria bacterium]|nr:hypothetical protein [Pseudomonadota bacterium]